MGGGGLVWVKGKEWVSRGFFPEESRSPFRKKIRLFLKSLPQFVVYNFQYKFKRSRPLEIFEEKFEKETLHIVPKSCKR